jgi:hypothetical protein
LHAELRAGCLARPTHPTITNRSSPHYAEALVAAGWPVGEWENSLVEKSKRVPEGWVA